MKKRSNNNVALFTREEVKETEDGLLITAVLKNFTRPNGNGELAEPDAYDEFVTEYYEKGGYNLPLCYMHDTANIIGVVTELSRDDAEMRMKATILKTCPQYDYISDLVRRGILGGVSDGSFVDGEYEETEDGGCIFHVKKGAMCEVSVVTVPAEISAGVVTINTKTHGFNHHNDGLADIFEPRIFEQNS